MSSKFNLSSSKFIIFGFDPTLNLINEPSYFQRIIENNKKKNRIRVRHSEKGGEKRGGNPPEFDLLFTFRYLVFRRIGGRKLEHFPHTVLQRIIEK